ncbi:MAG: hypothetical protein WBQ64_10220 [Terriglobales bacterium]
MAEARGDFSSMTDEQLLEHFVASFEKLNDLIAWENDPISVQLSVGSPDEFGFSHWRPAVIETLPSQLESVYAKLPARFPKLFERLVLSYRWAEVDLGMCRLLANPPGPDLTGMLVQMSRDPAIWGSLLPAGYIQFGKGPDVDYDPVCFDIKSRKKNGECRVVKIDHEEILCNNRVKLVAELAPSFRDLVLQTIEQA